MERCLKKKLLISLVLLVTTLCGPGLYKMARRDYYVPEKVVYLYGPGKRGSCSGIHVDINNKTYILSAAHCLALAKDGKILVQDDEMDDPIPREVLMEDSTADIIILEALPHRSGITLASSVEVKERLYTYTHGLGYATYKTEGTYIQDLVIEVPLFVVDETHKCDISKPKYIQKLLNLFIIQLDVCFLVEDTMVTDALIAPGSSGGVVTNKYGELVGLVSAGDNKFGYLVPLDSVQKFVSNWR